MLKIMKKKVNYCPSWKIRVSKVAPICWSRVDIILGGNPPLKKKQKK
jgi:hypothetical protein